MPTEEVVRIFQSVNEAGRDILRIYLQVIRDGVIDVLVGPIAGDDRLDAHQSICPRIRSRRASKYAASAGPAEGDCAPSSSRFRRCCRSWSRRISSRTYSLLVP